MSVTINPVGIVVPTKKTRVMVSEIRSISAPMSSVDGIKSLQFCPTNTLLICVDNSPMKLIFPIITMLRADRLVLRNKISCRLKFRLTPIDFTESSFSCMILKGNQLL